MKEIAFFSGKIYTADKYFTRPPVATVATNSKSVDMLSIHLHNVHDKSKSEEKCYHQEIILIPYSQKKHSWKNAQTVQTCLCCFSGLLCYFFAIGHARHPVSFRGGQTFFFYGISLDFEANFELWLLCYFFA